MSYEAPGRGLRPPSVLRNVRVDAPLGKHGSRRFSQVTCFETPLLKPVGHIGEDLKILVGHFHNESAKPARGAARKSDY